MSAYIKKPFQSGFTLIELMIAVVIVAILASLAMSNYGDSVVKSKRTDAKDALTSMAASLEKCKAMYGKYDGNCSIKDESSKTSPEGLYTVSVSVTDNTAFTLTATPVEGKSQARDTDCKSMTLNNLGVQKPIACW
jgi:type IV pilus assembly protein PilE